MIAAALRRLVGGAVPVLVDLHNRLEQDAHAPVNRLSRHLERSDRAARDAFARVDALETRVDELEARIADQVLPPTAGLLERVDRLEQLSLPDGTALVLNIDGTIRWISTGQSREAFLEDLHRASRAGDVVQDLTDAQRELRRARLDARAELDRLVRDIGPSCPNLACHHEHCQKVRALRATIDG